MSDLDDDKDFEISEEQEVAEEERYLKRLSEISSEIFSSPSDPDIQTIVKRIEDRDLILRPKFQRSEVWDDVRKSKLVESVFLNLPVPPVFLAEDEDGTKVVVDGQQRLQSIDDFFHNRLTLKGLEIAKDLNGLKFQNVSRQLDRRFKQRVLRVLTISYNAEIDVRFLIFERLNTGSVPLVDQEIRNATLSGTFNDLLNELATNNEFLSAIGAKSADKRLRHHELILRFFAVRFRFKQYSTPLKLFLSNYMKDNRRLRTESETALADDFKIGLKNCRTVFGEYAFRKLIIETGKYQKPLSRAVFELQMAVLSTLEVTMVSDRAVEIKTVFEALYKNQNFNELLTRGIDHRKRFFKRFSMFLEGLKAIGIDSVFKNEFPDQWDI